MTLRQVVCIVVPCLLAAPSIHAEERHVWTMYCAGKGIAYDTQGNAVTIVLAKDGKSSTASLHAERVEHINGFVAVDASAPGERYIFRFAENPRAGEDNNEALIVLTRVADGERQTTQSCTQTP